MLMTFLLHVADFPTDSGGPAAVDIHNVPATAVIRDDIPAVVGPSMLLLASLLLQVSLFLLTSLLSLL
jgi:hypothetical protein